MYEFILLGALFIHGKATSPKEKLHPLRFTSLLPASHPYVHRTGVRVRIQSLITSVATLICLAPLICLGRANFNPLSPDQPLTRMVANLIYLECRLAKLMDEPLIRTPYPP
ncbi:MAG: hypothetical protein K6U11_07880 [bacterium]|nr:hypothetical protein [bacterium]